MLKTFTTQEAREETKEEVEKDIWKICKSPNTGGHLCLKFGSAEENLRIFEKRDKF